MVATSLQIATPFLLPCSKLKLSVITFTAKSMRSLSGRASTAARSSGYLSMAASKAAISPSGMDIKSPGSRSMPVEPGLAFFGAGT